MSRQKAQLGSAIHDRHRVLQAPLLMAWLFVLACYERKKCESVSLSDMHRSGESWQRASWHKGVSVA